MIRDNQKMIVELREISRTLAEGQIALVGVLDRQGNLLDRIEERPDLGEEPDPLDIAG